MIGGAEDEAVPLGVADGFEVGGGVFALVFGAAGDEEDGDLVLLGLLIEAQGAGDGGAGAAFDPGVPILGDVAVVVLLLFFPVGERGFVDVEDESEFFAGFRPSRRGA